MRALRSLAPYALAFSVAAAGTLPAYAQQTQNTTLPPAQALTIDAQSVEQLARDVADIKARLSQLENLDRALAVADTVERVAKQSANIFVTSFEEVTPGTASPQFNAPPNSPFRDFFDQFNNQGPQQPQRRGSSLGSGFVIDGVNGYIVTNCHVVSGQDGVPAANNEYRIVVNDREFEATLVGFDKLTDLAVLKVDVAGVPLPQVTIADSDAVRIGEFVIAVGNPLGVGQTVSTGVVSAKHRVIGSGPLDDYIQTDAAINRGNSGGPLFNQNGEVIGVNTAIYSPNGGSIGLGFSIPSNLVKNVAQNIIDNGEVLRGYLGVRMQELTEQEALAAGLSAPKGVTIVELPDPQGPAASSGLRVGDILLSMDGEDIEGSKDLQSRVMGSRPNTVVQFKVIRDGQTIDVPVTLGELEHEKIEVKLPDEHGMITPDEEDGLEGETAPAPDAVPAPEQQSYRPPVAVPAFPAL